MKTSPFLDEIRAATRAETRTEDILRFVRLRFRTEPSTEILARIQSEHNLDRLNRWLDAAATANSLDEFLAAFHQG